MRNILFGIIMRVPAWVHAQHLKNDRAGTDRKLYYSVQNAERTAFGAMSDRVESASCPL